MKTLKKIVLGRALNNNQMDMLKGGSESNINDATSCSCTGSTQGSFWCDDNTNSAKGCQCTGNDNNTNEKTDCSCGFESGTTTGAIDPTGW